MTIIYVEGFGSISAEPSSALCACGYDRETSCNVLDPTCNNKPVHPMPPIKPGLGVMQTKSGRIIYWNDTTYFRLDGSEMPMDEVDSILSEAKGNGLIDDIKWDM